MASIPAAFASAYRRLARKAGKIWIEHGALEVRECVADDTRCDAMRGGFEQPQALREPLRALVQAQWQLLQAEHEVEQVADVLRRDQPYAPAGRPSVHIVQLRKQQAATKQVMLIARQRLAQVAQTFVQASGLAVKAKQSPSDAVAAWLQTLR